MNGPDEITKMTNTEVSQAQLTAETNAVSSAKLKLPATKEVIGELLSAETIESKSGDLVLVSIQTSGDEVITISAGTAYWKKIGRPFVEGSIVKFSYEQRLKGVTAYKNESGVLVPHTADGNNLSGATKFSAMAYQRMLDSVSKESDIATLEAVEVERVGAIAQYLGAYVSKR